MAVLTGFSVTGISCVKVSVLKQIMLKKLIRMLSISVRISSCITKYVSVA
jgi:hypothetical protein